MMIDMSELDGKGFSCLEGCGMCCLCQPELTSNEMKIFETDEYLRNGLTREHVNGRRTAKPNAIKLQGGRGACYFLKNRLCTINEIKPHFCRQFPVHIHVMRRIQLNVNLSCRGITEGGNNLRAYAKTLMSYIPDSRLADELSLAKNIATEFDQRCRSAGIYQAPERLRSITSKLMPMIKREDGIAKLLAYADGEPEIGDLAEEEVANQINVTAPAKDIDEIARESNYDLFNIDDIAKLPVYVDEKLRWIVFQSFSDEIRALILEEDGKVEPLMNIRKDDIELAQRDPESLNIFADYASLLNSRDPFMGNVASICDLHDYRHDLMTVYVGVLGMNLLDLWWRASLLARIKSIKKIDGWLAMESIRAYDMDCLDALTIGSFI